MLQSLNTKSVGYSAIVLLIVTALADDSVRSAIISAIQHPNASTIVGTLGVIASFVLAYYGKPHAVPDPTPPAAVQAPQKAA